MRPRIIVQSLSDSSDEKVSAAIKAAPLDGKIATHNYLVIPRLVILVDW